MNALRRNETPLYWRLNFSLLLIPLISSLHLSKSVNLERNITDLLLPFIAIKKL